MGNEYRINDSKIMKQFIKDIALFIVLILCFWTVGIVINTIIFCLFVDMDRNSPDFIMNQFFMVEINKMLVIPAFFVAKYFINKNEQTIF